MGQGEIYNGLPATQWSTFHTLAILVITLSVAGSLYITISTVQRYRANPQSMTFLQFLPFFISVSDVTCVFFHGADHIHNLIWSYGPDVGWCTVLGAGMVYGMNLAAFWTVATAIAMYIVIVRLQVIDAGPYYWKFTVPCFGIPLIPLIISVALDGYVWQDMYCGLNGGLFTTVFNTSYIIIAWFVSIFIYAKVFSVIRAQSMAVQYVDQSNKSSGFPSKMSTKSAALPTLLDLAHRLPWFVIAYIITWLPWTAYSIGAVVDANGKNSMPFWLLLLIVTFTHAGGVVNAFMYRFFLFKKRPSGKQANKQVLPTCHLGRC